MAKCCNTGLILDRKPLKGKYLICFFTNEEKPNFPVNDKETRPSKNILYGYLLPYVFFHCAVFNIHDTCDTNFLKVGLLYLFVTHCTVNDIFYSS